MNDRKAFEAWARADAYLGRPTPRWDQKRQIYDEIKLQCAWEGWQAARNRTMHDCIEQLREMWERDWQKPDVYEV